MVSDPETTEPGIRWSWQLAVIAAAFATTFAARRFESVHHLSALDPLEQEMTLTTESAFYYSYYREVTDAPSLWTAWEELRADRRTEAPDTINVLQRFNVLQEVCH